MSAAGTAHARRDAAAWGVVPSYTDALKVRRRPRRASVEAVLDALEAGTATPGAQPRRSITPPTQCHLPRGLRVGGLAVQLYAARSRRSWGIGDLADLRTLAEWSAGLGAGALLVSPLHAPLPTVPQQDSPYFASSRRFRTPLCLRIEEVDGFPEADGPELRRLAARGRRLNDTRIIDRDAVHALKLAALERLHARFSGDPDFDAYRSEQGASLGRFAAHSAITEAHGTAWRRWPATLRDPAGPSVTAWAAAHARRIDFHEWVQWQIDKQLQRASRGVAVIHDLAIGVDPEGFDAWLDQDLLVPAVRVGAPPDAFATAGQDWGLPAYHPWRLRAAAYAPFREVVRAGLRHAGGLRFDHVLGLFRQWWIPPGAGPAAGVYLRYPSAALLAVLAEESRRAGAFVVGEDLGTVGREVRHALAAHRILSCRLVWFEDDEPARLPRLAMAAVTTHDLPTVAGLWSGSDLQEQRRLGLEPDPAAHAATRHRLRAVVGRGARTLPDVCARLHSALAASPAAVVTATLDDLALVHERPNMPGAAASARPNWRLALPMPLEAVLEDDVARTTATTVFARARPWGTRG